MNLPESYRTFRMATWLGWQVESNWTDPFLFAMYVILKPLATAAILVVMYSIITGILMQLHLLMLPKVMNCIYRKVEKC